MRNKQLIGQRVPARLQVRKKGEIWRAESRDGSLGFSSGSFEEVLQWVRREVQKRVTFFKVLQKKGKTFGGVND